jgi:hypothetical protein
LDQGASLNINQSLSRLEIDINVNPSFPDWIKGPLLKPPVDQIKDYFGENVALYVSFTAFYTSFLIPIAALGIIQV